MNDIKSRRAALSRRPNGQSWLQGKWRFLVPFGAFLLVLAFTASSCDTTASQVNNETNTVDKQQALYQKNQPVPFYNYSVERDVLTQIYNARMRAVDTYTVVYSYGKPIWACPSKGYPIPYTTQLTNPDREVDNGYSSGWATTIAQAEPNGLFTGNTTATWVLCVRSLPGGASETDAVYVESEVQTFSFPVKIVDGQVVDAGGSSGFNVTINSQAAGGSVQSTPAPNK